LLFIDTFQDANARIKAVACKLRLQSSWLIYIHMIEPIGDDIAYIRELYKEIPKQHWLQQFMDNPVDFDLKLYYTNRYQNVSFVGKETFKESLQESDFTLIDTGEQTTWFVKFIKGTVLSYTVRSLSINEVGDERKFILPVNYSKTDKNEIKSRIDSVKQKMNELLLKYGSGITSTDEYRSFRSWIKHDMK